MSGTVRCSPLFSSLREVPSSAPFADRQFCEWAGQRTIPKGNSPARRRARIVRAASKDPQTRRTCTRWIEVIERSGCLEDSDGHGDVLSGNEARLLRRPGCRRGTTPWRRPTRLLAESARLLRRTRQGSLSQHVARPFFLSWSPWSSNDESRLLRLRVVTRPSTVWTECRARWLLILG